MTAARIRVYCALLLAVTVLGYGHLAATSHAGRDAQGRPLGTDFSDIYARDLCEGRKAASAVRRETPATAREEIFGADTPFYGWHYPPFFLPVAGALAMLPYLAALLAWLGATLLF